MIWHKKNGHLKKNHRIGVVLFSIFCSLLLSFSSISNALAYNNESYDLKPFNHWSVMYCNGCNVPSTRTSNYYDLKSYTDMLDNTGSITTSNGARIGGNYVLGDFVVSNTSTTRRARYASFHLEFNLVTFAVGRDLRPWVYTLPSFGVKSVDNATVLQSSVNYVYTPWSTTVQTAAQTTYLSLGTMTFFVDAIIDTNSNLSYVPVWLGNSDGSYWLSTTNSYTQVGTYMEQYNGYIYWYDEGELDIAAMQNVSNNVASGNQIIADDISKENSQDLEDRNNLENRANDSEQAGDNASQDAQNASTPLIGAITQIYGIVMNPQTTDCDIGPINLYNQLDLGTLDMCTFSIPQPLMAIGALLTIGLILLLAWSVLHCAIALYKDLFGK